MLVGTLGAIFLGNILAGKEQRALSNRQSRRGMVEELQELFM